MSSVPTTRSSDIPDQHQRFRRRVLVVDDSRLQRKILCGSLERWGYEVVEAGSAEDALEICHQHCPDMVISDWMMPGMTGIEFCEEFRKLTSDDYGYFILLTSRGEKNDIAQGLDAGADDFLIKPVSADELRARITAGGRIIEMQRELTRKNMVIGDTLHELQRLYDALDKDLIEAKKLQQSLMPQRFRKIGDSDLSLFLRSRGHVGGDLVGCYAIGDKHVGLYALDVSGHGISSALMTARLAGYLSCSAPDQNIALERTEDGSYRARPLDQAIAKLNELVLGEMDTEHYFTLMLAHIDLETGLVRFGQAGHPHPVIQRASGAVEQSGSGGFPVGLMSDMSFTTYETQLARGDRLLILSDGVTECPDEHGNLLEEAGLARMIEDLRHVQGVAFFDAMARRLEEFAGTADFPDDVSGILFEFHPEALAT